METYREPDAWARLDHDTAGDLAANLAGLPSAVRDDDEQAKRFDLLILQRQLAQLTGDELTAEQLRVQTQQIAAVPWANDSAQSRPSVAGRIAFRRGSSDEWWIDVTLPMLEHIRRRLRGLVRFIETGKRRHRLHRLRRHPRRPQTDRTAPGDRRHQLEPGSGPKPGPSCKNTTTTRRFAGCKGTCSLTKGPREPRTTMLEPAAPVARTNSNTPNRSHKAWACSSGRSSGWTGPQPPTRSADSWLAQRLHRHPDRVREPDRHQLTANGVMRAGRLYESPFTDTRPRGPDGIFASGDVDELIATLLGPGHRDRGHHLAELTSLS